MNKLQLLEADLRADPDNVFIRGELRDELVNELGYSHEEADVHASYISVMARRARLLAQAGEVMNGTLPHREGVIRAALGYVNLQGISGAAFHVVNVGEAPVVYDKPRKVGNEVHAVVIRIPAKWIIATARLLAAPAHRRRRPRGEA